MSQPRRLRPSPALVIASIALLVSLAGTGYAAVSLPANSVGTLQLKAGAVTNSKIAAGAVTSSKVKDHSLLGVDFRLGQIPSGPPGAPGPPGPVGAQGLTGPPGPAGLSAGYSRFVSGPVAVPGSMTTLASLTIPQPGNYLIWAKAYANTQTNALNDLDLTCNLVAGSDSDTTKVHAYGNSGESQSVDAIVAHQYTASGTADFRCMFPGDAATMNFIRIVAVQTSTLVTG